MAKSGAVQTKEMVLDVDFPALNNSFLIIKEISEGLPIYQAKWNELHGKAIELKDAGLIYAGTHYRERKYLYLVYPTDKSGHRKKEYVGADKDKQFEALEGIKRANEYDQVQRSIKRLEDRMNWVYESLDRAKAYL